MKKRIRYIGYYDEPENDQQREFYPAATNFMTYISETIFSEGHDVEIVSMSPTKGNKPVLGHKTKMKNGITLKTFFSPGNANRFLHRLNVHVVRWLMFLYLAMTTKKSDVLLVYHSLNYAQLLVNLKRLLKIKFILQACEIYQDVTDDLPQKLKAAEYEVFKTADAFIYSNDLLGEKIDPEQRRKSIVVYGIYKLKDKKGGNFCDGKIHVVYAGTLDPRKGGAAAAAAAEFLDERYHVHILGFGSDEQIRNMKEMCQSMNFSGGGATLTYDGLLLGDEFDKFMAKCHIGLSTQYPDAAFNETSFPSKIFTYLSYGLEVVSVRIKAVERSCVSSKIHFFDGHDPKCIADTVKNISVKKDAGDSVLEELDHSFRVGLNTIFEP